MPDGQATLVDLSLFDGESSAEYVVEYLGTYLVSPSSNTNVKEPYQGESASTTANGAAGSSSACAAQCFQLGFRLSENLNGECLCGSMPNFPSLTKVARGLVDISCGVNEYCGGGVPLSDNAGNSYIDIIVAVPSNDAVIVYADDTTISSSKPPVVCPHLDFVN